MTLKKLPLKGYKQHQGEGDQLSYNGIALNPKEQVIALKVNEIIDYVNNAEEMLTGLGMSIEQVAEGCCKEDDA